MHKFVGVLDKYGYLWICGCSLRTMAASKPVMDRLRRKEAFKTLKLRESTYMWNERKKAMGFQGITNSELPRFFYIKISMPNAIKLSRNELQG